RRSRLEAVRRARPSLCATFGRPLAGEALRGAATPAAAAGAQCQSARDRSRRINLEKLDGQAVTFRVLVTDEIDPEGVALPAAEPQISVDEVPTLPKEE